MRLSFIPSSTSKPLARLDGLVIMTSTEKTQKLILRLIAFCYFAAFVSLYKQIDQLMASTGLLPAHSLLRNIEARSLSFFQAPTIFALKSNFSTWMSSKAADFGLVGADDLDVVMYCCCLVGIVLSLAAVVSSKLHCIPIFFTCWLLYISFVTVGGDFFHFQWDVLLLEAG